MLRESAGLARPRDGNLSRASAALIRSARLTMTTWLVRWLFDAVQIATGAQSPPTEVRTLSPPLRSGGASFRNAHVRRPPPWYCPRVTDERFGDA